MDDRRQAGKLSQNVTSHPGHINSAWPSLRGWANEYQRKLGSKQAHRVMH